MSTGLPLKVKLEFRAITNNHLNRESAVVISSTIPSAKYSCSGSPLMFSNGNTAIEGLSGSASAVFAGVTDCSPRGIQAGRQRRIRHDPAIPDAGDQVILADHALPVGNQIGEQ